MRALDDAIKAEEDEKLAANKVRKSIQPISPLEKQLIEQLGFPMKININKNDAGYFRIPFHDRGHMQTILDRLGLKDIEPPGKI
ncbi:MAG TPA: hypothetical protein VLH77_07000 [Gammaproteobacteria bacterium]|nr:hypothetical protein [Gammaproteobacteria bacterium]